MAVVAVPIAKTPSVVKECVKAGVGGVIIISAGGKEIGAKLMRKKWVEPY